METIVRKKESRLGRNRLSKEQQSLLINNIQQTQINNEGLTKKVVAEKAFIETFGDNRDNWPIQLHSSTVCRYWRIAFPSEKSMNLSKKKRKGSVQPLLDDLRAPSVPTVPLDCVFHACPWCSKPIRALIVAAATVMK